MTKLLVLLILKMFVIHLYWLPGNPFSNLFNKLVVLLKKKNKKQNPSISLYLSHNVPMLKKLPILQKQRKQSIEPNRKDGILVEYTPYPTTTLSTLVHFLLILVGKILKMPLFSQDSRTESLDPYEYGITTMTVIKFIPYSPTDLKIQRSSGRLDLESFL